MISETFLNFLMVNIYVEIIVALKSLILYELTTFIEHKVMIDCFQSTKILKIYFMKIFVRPKVFVLTQ